MGKLPEPMAGTVFYEDDKVYACLAFEPIVEGHTIVHWKQKHSEDLSYLSSEDYLHLMTIVYEVRNALMQYYEAPKVYLAYLDETCDVHWHLFPRKKDAPMKGFEMMTQKGSPIKDLSAVEHLRSLCGRR
jgi:diadenosine tetraphosphate (Ap4A) HIT family hydrolase